MVNLKWNCIIKRICTINIIRNKEKKVYFNLRWMHLVTLRLLAKQFNKLLNVQCACTCYYFNFIFIQCVNRENEESKNLKYEQYIKNIIFSSDNSLCSMQCVFHWLKWNIFCRRVFKLLFINFAKINNFNSYTLECWEIWCYLSNSHPLKR